MESNEQPKILLSSPADLLGAVPYLIGFYPADSLVVVGFTGRPPAGRLRLTTRWDLPITRESLDRLVPLLRREGVTQVMLAGFGPGTLITPAVDQVTHLMREAGIEVSEALRAHEGRYWSYLCASTECCPPEGMPYDPRSSQIAAQATVNGLVALPDRSALERSLLPCDGLERMSMRRATSRASIGIQHGLADAATPDDYAAEFVAAGVKRVRKAIGTYRAGERLGDPEAARLGMDLSVIRVRDEAWTLIDDDTLTAHLALWKDLTRRLEAPFRPPAASLLAVTAWRFGDCALAGIAVERALTIDPSYSMAGLLMEGLHHLVSPEVLRERMPTPEELDDQMGRPRIAWLAPLLTLIGESTALAG